MRAVRVPAMKTVIRAITADFQQYKTTGAAAHCAAGKTVRFFKTYFLLFLSCLSLNIFALDNGECGTPEQMTAKFKAEGQRSFASAERSERENGSTVLYGMIFTVNADRSVGYIVQSDKPTGERASKICVRNRLADLRFFDARKPGLKPASLLKASDADALRKCDELIKSGKLNAGTCIAFNASMAKGEANGERIMMQGFNVEKQADGSYKKVGTMTTVTGNVNGSIYDDDKDPLKHIVSGIFFTALPEGATIINMTTIYAEYTPYGLSLLGQ